MTIFIRAVLLVAVAAFPLAAKTVEIPGENITIKVPDSWIEAKRPTAPYVYSAAAPGLVSAVGLAKLSNTDGHGITPSYISGTKQGMADSAAKAGATIKVTSENALTISGMPAYVFMTEMNAQGKTVEMSNYVIATHDSYYLLSLQTLDATQVSDLQAIANSFQFTVAPTAPDSGLNDFDAGEQVGRYIGYALPLLVLAVIVKIVVGKSRSAARK